MSEVRGKKILFLITQSKWGGAQKYVLQLAAFFCKHNDVRIVVGEKQIPDAYFFSEAKRIGVPVIQLEHLVRNISLVKAFDATLEMRRLLKKERPDLLHINSSMAGFIGSCAAWIYGLDPLNKAIRVVYTAHGFVFNEPLSPLKRRLYLFLERMSASWKSVLITVSEYDRQQGIKEKIASERKLVTIHNGISPDDTIFATQNEARNILNIREAGTPTIGTIASHYPTKNLETLLRAAEIIKKGGTTAKFILIGDGPDTENLKALAHELNLSDNVIFCGKIENAGRLVNAFDLFVLSSVKEGFPYILLEAGLAEVPIVATNVGGIPELITDHETGLLVEPRKPEALAAAIQHTLAHPDEAHQRTKKLQHSIEENFSRAQMLDQTEQLYLRILPTKN